MNEKIKIQSFLKRLLSAPKNPFPQIGPVNNAPTEQGVYIILDEKNEIETYKEIYQKLQKLYGLPKIDNLDSL